MKEEHTKENVRELILKTALEQFTKNGIKDVKMDDIASMLSVSKRTIYEHFKDKEQLLVEALQLHNEIMRKKGKEIIRHSKDILKIILKLYDLYIKTLSSTNRKFFSDIKKYPELCKKKTHDDNKNFKSFITWLEEGRRQGLFREDANFEIFSITLTRNLETIFMTNLNAGDDELSKHSPQELGRMIIVFYLRGISTLKGQEIIEEYLKENNI
ncbi:MAG: TetR/AcrR family transcriptional regulator [Bacteroidaceae bacterium]|nr:TetR/AcrR family transcriptional regulator [Bacteroidaceae bacterium]